MNARFCKEAITDLNWPPKKKKLEEMLGVLSRTEKAYQESKKQKKMFVSMTTLRGWRISILSTIAIVEELFTENYSFVLTGKFNQDALEVPR
jgi:hypothetical protein